MESDKYIQKLEELCKRIRDLNKDIEFNEDKLIKQSDSLSLWDKILANYKTPYRTQYPLRRIQPTRCPN